MQSKMCVARYDTVLSMSNYKCMFIYQVGGLYEVLMFSLCILHFVRVTDYESSFCSQVKQKVHHIYSTKG